MHFLQHLCMAVGEHENSSSVFQPLGEHWTGTNWESQTLPENSETSKPAGLYGISCISSSECMAVGYYVTGSSNIHATFAQRWASSKWETKLPPQLGADGVYVLKGVSCTSSTECVAVGYRENSTSKIYEALAELWNGTKWEVLTTLNPSGSKLTELTGFRAPPPLSQACGLKNAMGLATTRPHLVSMKHFAALERERMGN